MRFQAKKTGSGFAVEPSGDSASTAPGPAPQGSAPQAAQAEPPSAPPSPAVDSKDSVLLIEDDRLAREMVNQSLEFLDYPRVIGKPAPAVEDQRSFIRRQQVNEQRGH